MSSEAIPVARPRWKRWIEWVGTILCVAGLAFICSRLLALDPQVVTLVVDRIGGFLIPLVLVYAGSCTILAISWSFCLRHRGVVLDQVWLIRVFARTQLAKYLPGNVFHIAGMFASLASKGVGARISGYSVAAQQIAMLIGGSPFALLGLAVILSGPLPSAAIILLCVLVAAVMAASILARNNLLRALAVSLLFHFITASLFVFVMLRLDPTLSKSLTVLSSYVCLYELGWLVGTVTPGAPAGLGVREAVILAGLDPTTTSRMVAPAVAIMRVVTILGDLTFFLSSFALRRRADHD